jgi:hypothetical protein
MVRHEIAFADPRDDDTTRPRTPGLPFVRVGMRDGANPPPLSAKQHAWQNL